LPSDDTVALKKSPLPGGSEFGMRLMPQLDLLTCIFQALPRGPAHAPTIFDSLQLLHLVVLRHHRLPHTADPHHPNLQGEVWVQEALVPLLKDQVLAADFSDGCRRLFRRGHYCSLPLSAHYFNFGLFFVATQDTWLSFAQYEHRQELSAVANKLNFGTML
jgi:hypothetical protein